MCVGRRSAAACLATRSQAETWLTGCDQETNCMWISCIREKRTNVDKNFWTYATSTYSAAPRMHCFSSGSPIADCEAVTIIHFHMLFWEHPKNAIKYHQIFSNMGRFTKNVKHAAVFSELGNLVTQNTKEIFLSAESLWPSFPSFHVTVASDSNRF